MKAYKLLLLAFLFASSVAQAQTFTVVHVNGTIHKQGVPLKVDDVITLENNRLPSDVTIGDNAEAAVFNPSHGKRILKKSGVSAVAGGGDKSHTVRKVESARGHLFDFSPAHMYVADGHPFIRLNVFPGLVPAYYVAGLRNYQIKSKADRLVLTYKWHHKHYSKELVPVAYGRDTVQLINLHPDSLFTVDGVKAPPSEVQDVQIEFHSPALADKKAGPYAFRVVFLDRDEAFLSEVKILQKEFAKDPALLVEQFNKHLREAYDLGPLKSEEVLGWLAQKFQYKRTN